MIAKFNCRYMYVRIRIAIIYIHANKYTDIRVR